MAFLIDVQELKPGLLVFRRADVKHRNWYCRIKLSDADRYKSASFKTADIDAAKEKAFDQDADVGFRIKHQVPIFNRPFSQVEGLRGFAEGASRSRRDLPQAMGVGRLNDPREPQPLRWRDTDQPTRAGQVEGYPFWRQRTWREEREHRIANWGRMPAWREDVVLFLRRRLWRSGQTRSSQGRIERRQGMADARTRTGGLRRGVIG
jgi:hypothetical protein